MNTKLVTDLQVGDHVRTGPNVYERVIRVTPHPSGYVIVATRKRIVPIPDFCPVAYVTAREAEEARDSVRT